MPGVAAMTSPRKPEATRDGVVEVAEVMTLICDLLSALERVPRHPGRESHCAPENSLAGRSYFRE
jgi:hypothetical protein